ncbi:MAG: hypothetical protein AAGC81_16340 [Pseudomonadota bacterium]
MSMTGVGHLFRTVTWGERHGSALDAIVDGCPLAGRSRRRTSGDHDFGENR